MSRDLIKLNTASFNLLFFLDYCRKDKQLSENIDKVYEIVVYAFIETILKYLNPRVNIKVDCEAKKIINDFSLTKNFFLGLSTNTLQFLQADCLSLDETRCENNSIEVWSNFEKAIKIKYIALDEHAMPENTQNKNYENFIVVCKETEKTIIKIIALQLGLKKKIHGFISESTLVEWYRKSISPKYINSVGKAAIKTLNKKFKTEFPSTPLSPAMMALKNTNL
jgi:hypothetical protein